MIAKYIARIHSLGVNAKGNVIADRTCVIILMDVHLYEKVISKHYQFKNMYLMLKTITFDSLLLYSRHTMTLHKGVEYNVSYFKSCAQYKHINDYSKIN